MAWQSTQNLTSRKFTCGHCKSDVASAKGWHGPADIRVCPNCDQPTVFGNNYTMPGVAFGDPVSHLPPHVETAYNEARRCMSVAAYTAAALLARKLLMNVCVAQGADEGKSFAHYIAFLEDKHYVPPNSREWVDDIRKQGNEATHEVPATTQHGAEELILFIEALLKHIYEFPARARSRRGA